jgi:hypothetical protein
MSFARSTSAKPAPRHATNRYGARQQGRTTFLRTTGFYCARGVRPDGLVAWSSRFGFAVVPIHFAGRQVHAILTLDFCAAVCAGISARCGKDVR